MNKSFFIVGYLLIILQILSFGFVVKSSIVKDNYINGNIDSIEGNFREAESRISKRNIINMGDKDHKDDQSYELLNRKRRLVYLSGYFGLSYPSYYDSYGCYYY